MKPAIYTATLEGFKASTGFREQQGCTVDLTDLRDSDGNPVCKAAQFRLGKHALPFEWSQRIQFTATFTGNHLTGVLNHLHDIKPALPNGDVVFPKEIKGLWIEHTPNPEIAERSAK